MRFRLRSTTGKSSRLSVVEAGFVVNKTNGRQSTIAYLYILECADGSFYTGSTKDLPCRLWQHQNGLGANYTKKRLPVNLVYAEEFERVDDAFYREQQVQGWSRAKKIALMQGNWDRVRILAECQNESHYRGMEVSTQFILSEVEGLNQRKEP